MRYLYIDTSSSYLYTAIIEDEKILAEIQEEYGQSLSEVAMPKIASMFEKSNLSAKDIDKIIVVNGPGSFTGIRIGITIAKVYAWTLNLPITTIYSLEAMALSSDNKKGITIIEWADMIPDYLPEKRLDIKIKNSMEDENKRIITITPYGKKYEELCEAIL